MNILDFQQGITNKLRERKKLLVAFSGGLDSSVLLHALVQLRQQHSLEIRAIHIHHGLSRFADSWVKHCQLICDALKVPLKVVHVDVNRGGQGLEAAARIARYQAIAAYLLSGELLLTAQHQDDQCETLLLALKRGSGPAGLSGMAEEMPFRQNMLLRPLLDISRSQLEAYALQHQLTWIEDESNQDDRFDRNFLRLRILPELSERWPHFASAAARSAALCAEQESLLDELLRDALDSLIDVNRSLDIEGLTSMSEVKRYALLRRWIADFGVQMPARDQLQRVWNEVVLSREDAEPQLTLGAWVFRRFRQRLYLLLQTVPLTDTVLFWQPPDDLILPDNLGCLKVDTQGRGIRQPRRGETVTVRFFAQGKIRIVGRDHSRQIKKIWQELGIPPWQRTRTPLIYYADTLIAAPGVFVTRDAIAEDNEAEWQIKWQKLE
ncbi:tRNA lysidine(34) synthetase TilS [Edaphovirga cremea]|uniref:tRNA lysidine(34) synthetase TilS n=1 Tax=Edaphovirga cremea TaxID=2267246 RepID=UPI000DEFCBFE|nr:tRNA lysidine(34) synthetase TilS [Edaphovirga cremea]